MKDTSLMGRADIVVLHHDGNNNDPDDHSAIVIGSLLTRAAGHQSKTHLFFGNNLAERNEAMLANARAAADYAEELGITTHDYQKGISRTTAELAALLNSGKSVLMIEGGPMEATYRAMEKVSAANLDNITFVSHSSWNENRTENDLLKATPRDWADLKADFPAATFIDISDQNKNYKSSEWSWLDKTGTDSIFDLPRADEILGAGRTIMEAAGYRKNDASDAGMVAYALTGKQDVTPAETRKYLIDNWDNISAGAPEPQPEPQPQPQPEPEPERGDISFDLAIAYDSGKLIDADLTKGEALALDDLDGGRLTLKAMPSDGVGSMRMNLVGVHERVENVAPYVLFGDEDGDFSTGRELGAGDYKMVLTAYSGSNGSGSVLGSDTIEFSIAADPETAPETDPSPSTGSAIAYRWNAGPGTVEAVDGGPDWVADAGAVVGSARLYAGKIDSHDASAPGTTPDGIFAHEYYGKSAGMGLEFGGGELEDGRYAVRLYMGNGYSGTDDPGERVFDVRVEGGLFLDDLDLADELGHQVGGMFEWRGTVDDGTIDIDFVHGVENPLINAVEIIRLETDALV